MGSGRVALLQPPPTHHLNPPTAPFSFFASKPLIWFRFRHEREGRKGRKGVGRFGISVGEHTQENDAERFQDESGQGEGDRAQGVADLRRGPLPVRRLGVMVHVEVTAFGVNAFFPAVGQGWGGWTAAATAHRAGLGSPSRPFHQAIARHLALLLRTTRLTVLPLIMCGTP